MIVSVTGSHLWKKILTGIFHLLDEIALRKPGWYLGTAEHWFPGHDAAKFDPAALKKALPKSPFAQRVPEILAETHTLLFEAPKMRLSQN